MKHLIPPTATKWEQLSVVSYSTNAHMHSHLISEIKKFWSLMYLWTLVIAKSLLRMGKKYRSSLVMTVTNQLTTTVSTLHWMAAGNWIAFKRWITRTKISPCSLLITSPLSSRGVRPFSPNLSLQSSCSMRLSAILDPSGPLDDSYADIFNANSWRMKLTSSL